VPVARFHRLARPSGATALLRNPDGPGLAPGFSIRSEVVRRRPASDAGEDRTPQPAGAAAILKELGALPPSSNHFFGLAVGAGLADLADATLACLAFLLTDFGDLSPITVLPFLRVELTSGMIVSPDVKPILPRAAPCVNNLTGRNSFFPALAFSLQDLACHPRAWKLRHLGH
jgi:hypothetical protein